MSQHSGGRAEALDLVFAPAVVRVDHGASLDDLVVGEPHTHLAVSS
jgi:hypothetical protein